MQQLRAVYSVYASLKETGSQTAGLEVIAEGFNLFNRSNFQLPNNTFGQGTEPLPTFGRPTGAADPRQLQFGLRLNF